MKSQFQGVLRNERRDSWEKGKRSITLLEDKSTRAIKCLALHYYSNVGQCISREILMTKGSG
jgi:hypothetical protein